MKSRSLRTSTVLILAFVVAFCFLLICSKNSPLYPMNDWGDVNCFMTVGRSVLDGKLMYTEIYEQKGPLLYFLFAFAALISPGSFLGVFIIETLCFAAFLYFSALLARLFHKRDGLAADLAVMAAAAFAAVNSGSFCHGGSVEELCLFMLAASLYFAVKAIREKKPVGRLRAFIIGAFGAAALWSKFTVCGFFFGLSVFLFFSALADRSRRKALLGDIPAFIGGAAAVSLPILLYFAVNNNLGDLLRSYFYNNIFAYVPESGFAGAMIRTLPRNLLIGIKHCFTRNLYAAPFFLLIPAHYLIFGRERKKELFFIACCGFFLLLSTFPSSRRYGYYPHIFIAFAPVGIGCAAELLGRAFRALKAKKTILRLCAGLLFAGLLALSLFVNGNTYLIGFPREAMPQYRFAAVINERPGATVLNYNFLDGGFYFAADKLPVTKFFCRLNLSLPEMDGELDAAVTGRTVDFIITRDAPLEDFFPGETGYHCADRATMYFEGYDRVYYLYARDDAGH